MVTLHKRQFVAVLEHTMINTNSTPGVTALEKPQSRREAEAIEPSAEDNFLTGRIVDAALQVHRTLGPGLLESVYEQCLTCELTARGLSVVRQVVVPVTYRNIRIDAGFRMDLVVGNTVVIEVKASEKLLPVHKAQLLTYLKLSGHRLGLLMNFNVPRLRDGIHRLVQTSNPLRLCASAVSSVDGPSSDKRLGVPERSTVTPPRRAKPPTAPEPDGEEERR
jgi:GxxExxY protein